MTQSFSGRRSAISETLSADEPVVSRSGVAHGLRLIALALINLFVLLLWLGLVAWLIGRVLTDRHPWSQWLWWIPTPATLVAAALGFTLAFRAARTRARRKRRIRFWAACGLALLTYFALIEHHLLKSAPSPTSDALTIAHWNMTLDNHADIPALLRGVASLDSDIITITTPPSSVHQALQDAAAESDSRLHVQPCWPMLLVSKLPILRTRVMVGVDRSFVTRVELDASAEFGEGRTLTIDLVDLPSSPRRSRMRIARDVRALLDAADATAPDIAIGDFNITRNSASLETLYPRMTDAYNEAGHGYGASFHRRFPLYHIDHILLRNDSGLHAIRYDLMDEGLSRHRAQKAWIVAE